LLSYIVVMCINRRH